MSYPKGLNPDAIKSIADELKSAFPDAVYGPPTDREEEENIDELCRPKSVTPLSEPVVALSYDQHCLEVARIQNKGSRSTPTFKAARP